VKHSSKQYFENRILPPIHLHQKTSHYVLQSFGAPYRTGYEVGGGAMSVLAPSFRREALCLLSLWCPRASGGSVSSPVVRMFGAWMFRLLRFRDPVTGISLVWPSVSLVRRWMSSMSLFAICVLTPGRC